MIIIFRLSRQLRQLFFALGLELFDQLAKKNLLTNLAFSPGITIMYFVTIMLVFSLNLGGLSPRKSPPPKRQPSRTLKSLKKKIGRDREHLVNDENEEIVIGSDDDLETLLEVASGSKTKKRAAVSDEAKNLEEYRRMISSLGRKRTANDAAIGRKYSLTLK